MKLFQNIQDYFREIKIELKKVSWVTRKDVVRYVIMVVVFSFIVTLILGLFDFAFLQLIRKIIIK